MKLKGGAKFKGKLTRGLKHDIRNLVNFHASSWKSENVHVNGLILSKSYKVLDEKVKRNYVSWHWRKMQSLKKNWLLVPKMTSGIWWISRRAVAGLKVCTLLCYFCWKYIMFESKRCRGVMCHNTEEWCKIWGRTDLRFENWHWQFGELHQNTQKS